MDKLRTIQTRLKAPKGQRNTFGNYNYRSAEDILEAVKPLLAEEEATLTLSDEIVEVGGRIYVKATATFYTAGNEPVQVTAYAREAEVKKGMDDSQITVTASSYARKYALNGLFLIDDTKDADTDEYQKRTRKAEPEKWASLEDKAEAIDNLKALLEAAGKSEAAFLEHVGISDFRYLTMEQYAEWARRLKK